MIFRCKTCLDNVAIISSIVKIYFWRFDALVWSCVHIEHSTDPLSYLSLSNRWWSRCSHAPSATSTSLRMASTESLTAKYKGIGLKKMITSQIYAFYLNCYNGVMVAHPNDRFLALMMRPGDLFCHTNISAINISSFHIYLW